MINAYNKTLNKSSGEDPHPVGSVDVWPTGSVTFFVGYGSYLSQLIYKMFFFNV